MFKRKDREDITRERVKVITRFFGVLDTLIDERVLRGTKTFTDMYGINRRNFQKLRADIENKSTWFDIVWVIYFARDFYVSPTWIFTGEGGMLFPGRSFDELRAKFRPKLAKKLQASGHPFPTN